MKADLPSPRRRRPGAEAVSACDSCAAHNPSALRRLGVAVSPESRVVALAGNPNTGKSTVFNALTGLRQHVGNWSGSTVARSEGAFEFEGTAFTVVDLPGTYSLLSTSRDEDIARDFLVFGMPDVVVVVVDATRLERNLNLVLQVRQVTARVVVALNLMDEADRHGIDINVRHLTRELGVPVVPMVARRAAGLAELVAQIHQVATTRVRPVRLGRAGGRGLVNDPAVARAVDELAAELLAEFPGLTNPEWVALRLLEQDPGTVRAVQDGTLGELARHQAQVES